VNTNIFQAEAKTTNRGVSIVFNKPIKPSPGVYSVIFKANKKVFYVGEGSNLSVRLTKLFRCYPINPHPCHEAYERAYGSFPTPQQFCADFEAHVQETIGMRGRLEIEEELQEEHGSNNADFYRSWGNNLQAQKITKLFTNPITKLVPHRVPISAQMRKVGTWIFSKSLAEQLPEKGEAIRIILPNHERVDGRIGKSSGKFLNQARSALREFLAKHPRAKAFTAELGFEGETQTLTLVI
jgi:hypothetical protein